MISLPKFYTQLENYTPIGNSTINNIGCLTVDASMAATYFGHPIDPSTLARSVKYQGNLWIWGELTRLFPDIIYKGQVQTPDVLTDSQMNQIKNLIDKGYPVFLQIQTPSIPEHWLLAVGYNGDDFLCADPLRNPPVVHPITDYGIPPREAIYTFAWYEGKLPAGTTPVETIESLKRKIKDLEQTEIRLKKEKEALQIEMTNKLALKDSECKAKLDKIIGYTQSLK